MNIKTENNSKNPSNDYRYFLWSNIEGVEILLVFTDWNEGNNAKRNKHQKYYLPKGTIKNHKFIIDGKNFYD